MRSLNELFEEGIRNAASDVLLICGKPPQIKVDGFFKSVPDEPRINGEQIIEFARELAELSQQPFNELESKIRRNGHAELALTLGTTRLRVSAYLERGSYAVSVRLLPQRIFSFEEIFVLRQYIPKIQSLLHRQNGLILVTGPTGTGKTTTLATFLDYILHTRSVHFVTLEDPVEFDFRNEDYLGMVSQREYGRDFFDFAGAIVGGMRQAPNGFILSEIRDLPTAETALRAAETGHLVLATLHTRSAAQTVTRYVEIFKEEVRPFIRTQFSLSVIAILCQRLIPHASGRGRVACFEIVFVTPAYTNLIREWKIHQLDSYVRGESGIRYDEYLVELVRKGHVAYKTAPDYANNPDELRRWLGEFKNPD